MTQTRKRIYQEEFLSYWFTQIEDKGIIKPQCINSLFESTDCRILKKEPIEETLG
jgi:hypothetical protein